MKLVRLISVVCAMCFAVSFARADEFADKVDLAPLQSLTVQHRQTLKTLDSYSRQTVTAIAGRSTIRDTGDATVDKRPSLYAILDMSFRPEVYRHFNIIRIRNVPLRMDFKEMTTLSDAEKKRILQEGTIAMEFYEREDTQQFLMKLQSSANFKADAVNQLASAAGTMQQHAGPEFRLPPLHFIAPPAGQTADNKWKTIDEVSGTVPAYADFLKSQGQTPPPAIAGYDATNLDKIIQNYAALVNAWRSRDVKTANAAIVELAKLLPGVNSAVYPSETKRRAEVVYNRLAWMTLPGAAFYFFAFTLFLLSARSGVSTLRLWGLRMFVIGLLIHTAGIGIRWWLVEKSTDDWFHSIPIKNMFESVMMSAFFGAIIGLILELKRGRGIFGAAATFVGWMSLVGIFAAPYVTGRDIGGEIGQVNGVLMSYWLYVHVTVVVASYALIGMGFLLGIWWLVKYYLNYGTLKRVPSRMLSGDAVRYEEIAYSDSGAPALSMSRTILATLFLQRRPVVASETRAASIAPASRTERFLATLDLCNLVVMQLAFWLLGIGIIFGAIWADMSWGRPWGWDPKETFALVTWIVYLVVVHVRVATQDKAWWTAVLSVVGFFIMLFNWIGVNFFLVGLHSYA